MSRDFVLLFAGSSLARFRELARLCAAAGLLKEFLLVDESQNAELFLGKTNKRVQYLDYLATRFGGSSSVTAATLAVGAAPDENLQKLRSAFVHDLRQRCADKDIPFREGTISVPLADGELSPTFIEPTWTFNLVAVPEDWTGESQQIGVPLAFDAAEDIAFNIAATITGLWSWVDTPPLDQGVLREHVEQPPLRLIRATTRIVPLGNIVDVIAFAAMDPRNSWPTPENCEKQPHSESFVSAVLDALVNSKDAELALRKPSVAPVPSKERLGIIDSIILYLGHLVANLLGQPAKAWERAKEKAISWAESYVQRKTFQDESRLAVRFGGRLRDDDFVGDGNFRSSAIAETSGMEVPAVQPTPNRWRGITRVVLGAVDGGPIDSVSDIDRGYLAPKFRGSIAVAESRSVVCPDPMAPLGKEFLATLSVNGEPNSFSVRAFDVIRFREIHQELTKDVKNLRPEVNEGEDDLHETENLKFEDGERTQIKNQLEAWYKLRKDTLLWSIGKYVDTQIQTATDRLKESLAVVESIPKRIAEADAAQKKKVRRGKWLARILLLLLVCAVALPFAPPVAAAGILAGGALATALFFLPYLILLGIIGGWLANAKAQVREEFKLAQIESEEERALLERRHFWREIHRLEYCYAHFLDWAEILSTVIWRPFGSVELVSEPEATAPSVKALSFQFASPHFEPEAVLSEQIAMRTHVAGRGWLNEIFDRIQVDFASTYSRLTSLEGIEVDPYFDISLVNEFVEVGNQRLYKPRHQLLQDLQAGRPQQIVAENKLRDIRDSVSQTDLSHLVDYVAAHAFVQLEGEREQREVKDFVAPILEIKSLPVFERFVERSGSNSKMSVGSVYWSAAGFRPSVLPSDIDYEVNGEFGSSANAGVIATCRVDISAERFRASELTFIRQVKNQAPKLADRLPVSPQEEIRNQRKKID